MLELSIAFIRSCGDDATELVIDFGTCKKTVPDDSELSPYALRLDALAAVAASSGDGMELEYILDEFESLRLLLRWRFDAFFSRDLPNIDFFFLVMVSVSDSVIKYRIHKIIKYYKR